MKFNFRIEGIPCTVAVLYYDPGTSQPIDSASLEPNDPEEFEYIILDRKGYPAKWLEAKITEAAEAGILSEFKERLCEMKMK